jgi:hypothetical protein
VKQLETNRTVEQNTATQAWSRGASGELDSNESHLHKNSELPSLRQDWGESAALRSARKKIEYGKVDDVGGSPMPEVSEKYNQSLSDKEGDRLLLSASTITSCNHSVSAAITGWVGTDSLCAIGRGIPAMDPPRASSAECDVRLAGPMPRIGRLSFLTCASSGGGLGALIALCTTGFFKKFISLTRLSI